MEHRTNPSQRRLGTSQLHQNVIYGSVLFLLGLASGFVQVYHSDIIHLVNFFFLNHFHLFQCKTIHTHNTLLQIQKNHQVATEDPTNQPNTNAPDVFCLPDRWEITFVVAWSIDPTLLAVKSFDQMDRLQALIPWRFDSQPGILGRLGLNQVVVLHGFLGG